MKHWLATRPGKQWIGIDQFRACKKAAKSLESVPRMRLSVFTQGGVLRATWCKIQGEWICVEPGMELMWMKNLTPEATRNELIRRGWSWQWV